ncbi:MAG: proton-conducting transporter membrane subunit [Chloroflexota bacterium]
MSTDQAAALPFALLWVGAIAIWSASRVIRPDGRTWSALAAAVALAAGTATLVWGGADSALGGTLRRDGAATFVTVLITMCGCGTLLLHVGTVPRGSTRSGEAAALCLLSISGAMLVAGAVDLVVAFVGMELMALPLYALSGLVRDAHRPHAAALTQHVAGGVASAVFAYGIALVYAGTGSTALGALGQSDAPSALAGTALVIVGLGVRAALVPFHVWAPDAMVAAPPHASAFIASVPKVAVFALLLRASGALDDPAAGLDWRASLALMAATTILVAELSALRQTSLRRLLAYGAVSQAGYLAIAGATGVGASAATLFALVVFAALNIGAFGAVSRIASDAPTTDDLGGLVRRHPLFAATSIVLLLGLAGLPPTGGFIAKVVIFEAATRSQLAWLVILGAAMSAVAAATYLRVIFACFAEGEGAPVHRTSVSSVVVAMAAVVVLVLGVMPGPLLDAVRDLQF